MDLKFLERCHKYAYGTSPVVEDIKYIHSLYKKELLDLVSEIVRLLNTGIPDYGNIIGALGYLLRVHKETCPDTHPSADVLIQLMKLDEIGPFLPKILFSELGQLKYRDSYKFMLDFIRAKSADQNINLIGKDIMCSNCPRMAVVMLCGDKIAEFHQFNIMGYGFTGNFGSNVEGPNRLKMIMNALIERDFELIYQFDFLSVPFFCHECKQVYCDKCWRQHDFFDSEGYFDKTTGDCPKGHYRLLND